MDLMAHFARSAAKWSIWENGLERKMQSPSRCGLNIWKSSQTCLRANTWINQMKSSKVYGWLTTKQCAKLISTDEWENLAVNRSRSLCRSTE